MHSGPQRLEKCRIPEKERGAGPVTGRLDEARSAWKKALELSRRPVDRAFEASAGKPRRSGLETGQVHQAREFFEKGPENTPGGGRPASEGIIPMNLGIAHRTWAGRRGESLLRERPGDRPRRETGARRDVLATSAPCLGAGSLESGELLRAGPGRAQGMGNRSRRDNPG